MYQALYSQLDERRKLLDPEVQFKDKNPFDAYKHIMGAAKALVDPSVVYRVVGSDYVKTYFKSVLFDIANTALYVVTTIDKRDSLPLPDSFDLH